jgi:hypothetical protein
LVTDKSATLSLNTRENFLQSAAKHISQEPICPEEELSVRERTLNFHSWQMARLLGVGRSQGEDQGTYIKSSLKNSKVKPPILYCTPKDHKAIPGVRNTWDLQEGQYVGPKRPQIPNSVTH